MDSSTSSGQSSGGRGERRGGADGGRPIMRMWIANALLAGSWLLGLGYFDPANPIAWACTLVAAVILLLPTRRCACPGFGSDWLPCCCFHLPSGSSLSRTRASRRFCWSGIAASLAPIPSRWLRAVLAWCRACRCDPFAPVAGTARLPDQDGSSPRTSGPAFRAGGRVSSTAGCRRDDRLSDTRPAQRVHDGPRRRDVGTAVCTGHRLLRRGWLGSADLTGIQRAASSCQRHAAAAQHARLAVALRRLGLCASRIAGNARAPATVASDHGNRPQRWRDPGQHLGSYRPVAGFCRPGRAARAAPPRSPSDRFDHRAVCRRCRSTVAGDKAVPWAVAFWPS